MQAELERIVRQTDAVGREFLEAAIALAQRRSGAGANAGAREVIARARLEGEDAELVTRLFEQRDALVFSGGIATELTEEDRRAFRALLERFGRPALQPA